MSARPYPAVTMRVGVGVPTTVAQFHARLAHLIDDDPATRCWVWKGTMANGRPTLALANRTVVIARLAYELVAQVRLGRRHLHRWCLTERCVNPAHHLPSRPAYRNARAKLTNEQAQEIRRRHRNGETQPALAREYGMHQSAVWGLIQHETYRTAPIGMPGHAPGEIAHRVDTGSPHAY